MSKMFLKVVFKTVYKIEFLICTVVKSSALCAAARALFRKDNKLEFGSADAPS